MVKRLLVSANEEFMVSFDSRSIYLIDVTGEPRISMKFVFHQSVNI